jgi:NADH-quinone oxidoreductase subunit K|tara:strand:+ start:2523 stop:2924 length:402 start_codon:yes stop_codon:yes gene_type:complete
MGIFFVKIALVTFYFLPKCFSTFFVYDWFLNMFFSLDVLVTVSTVIFLFGVVGLVLNKRNLLIILMAIELMLLGLNLNFIFFSVYLDDIFGQIFALYVLTVAAAESAIGLAIFTVYFRDKQTLLLEGFVRSKG